MSTNTYKKGNIITFNSRNLKYLFNLSLDLNKSFAIIHHIHELTSGKNYSKYDIITGCGDKNSKVEVAFRIINIDFKLEEKIHKLNPHKLGLVENSIKDKIKENLEYIKIYQKLLLVDDEQSILNKKLKKIKNTQ